MPNVLGIKTNNMHSNKIINEPEDFTTTKIGWKYISLFLIPIIIFCQKLNEMKWPN